MALKKTYNISIELWIKSGCQSKNVLRKVLFVGIEEKEKADKITKRLDKVLYVLNLFEKRSFYSCCTGKRFAFEVVTTKHGIPTNEQV
jgi:hypothetical protein